MNRCRLSQGLLDLLCEPKPAQFVLQLAGRPGEILGCLDIHLGDRIDLADGPIDEFDSPSLIKGCRCNLIGQIANTCDPGNNLLQSRRRLTGDKRA